METWVSMALLPLFSLMLWGNYNVLGPWFRLPRRMGRGFFPYCWTPCELSHVYARLGMQAGREHAVGFLQRRFAVGRRADLGLAVHRKHSHWSPQHCQCDPFWFSVQC